MHHDGMRAVREGVAITTGDHFTALRISGGDAAWETVSRLTSGDLFLRDGQVLHSLWLDEAAHPLADVYVLRDDEAFVILAESYESELYEWASRHASPGATIEPLGESHRVLSLNGPFAWELLSEIVGADLVSLPYMAGFKIEGGWAMRAGKTGEFGYDMVVPFERHRHLEARLRDAGRRFDLADANLEVLEQCMLENWFFNIRREGTLGATPIELQLQWRTTRARDYVGKSALDVLRASGPPPRRLTTLVASGSVKTGDEVKLFGDRVGTVANAGGGFALALIESAFAHPSIDGFEIADAAVSARSITPPIPNNRSLHVHPQRHSYLTRDEISFPPLFGT
jgi:glycine cleavage system aminomethyltransferase T